MLPEGKLRTASDPPKLQFKTGLSLHCNKPNVGFLRWGVREGEYYLSIYVPNISNNLYVTITLQNVHYFKWRKCGTKIWRECFWFQALNMVLILFQSLLNIMISSMVFKAASSVFICHSPWTLDFLLSQSLPRPCLSNYQPRTAFSSSFCRAISQVAAQGSNKGQSWLSGGCLTWQGSLSSSAFTSSLGAQIDELEPLLPHQVLLATFQTSHTRHTLQGKQPNPMDLSSFALREF